MFTPAPKICSILLLGVIAGAISAAIARADGHGNGWKEGPNITIVNGTDDWTVLMDPGPMTCSEGDISFLPDGTAVCPPGSLLQVRDFTAYSNMYADDPRLAGWLTYTFSGNFDNNYTGPAWGTWTLEVASCDGAWEGTFTGDRSFVADQPNPLGLAGVWISTFELRGSGNGECVDRLGMKGTEIITTLTPMPLPYEILEFAFPGLCGAGCLPEGISSAKILGAWND